MCGCLGFREKLLFPEAAVLAYGSKNRKVRSGERERAAAIFALTDLGGGKRRNLHANEKFFPFLFLQHQQLKSCSSLEFFYASENVFEFERKQTLFNWR